MNFLVYEHVSGGGLADQQIQLDVLSEGYGMLRALTSDLRAAGHKVTCLLDSRICALNPPIQADRVISVRSSQESEKALERLSRVFDAVYVIAPEQGQTLQRLVELVEESGGTSLNCHVDGLGRASNKAEACEVLKKHGLPVPRTYVFRVQEGAEHVRRMVSRLEFPLVLKPANGVGCCGLSVVQDESQICQAFDKAKEASAEIVVVQRMVEGVAASVSLISTDREALPITLNEQMIALAPPESESAYMGGIVPLRHRWEKEAMEMARRTVESLTGLRGYVGVDMVLTDNGPVVMEINPRLTTSYLGLRRVIKFNLAQAIVEAVLGQRLPIQEQTVGHAVISKMKISAPAVGSLPETCKLENLLSPPFPVGGEMAWALLVAHSVKLEDAKIQIEETKKLLQKIVSAR